MAVSTTSNVNTTGTVQVTKLAAGTNRRPPFWVADESAGSFWYNSGYQPESEAAGAN
jgi:hypothetical protein